MRLTKLLIKGGNGMSYLVHKTISAGLGLLSRLIGKSKLQCIYKCAGYCRNKEDKERC